MTADHEPRPEYVEHLEWWLDGALRRAERRGGETSPPQQPVVTPVRRGPWRLGVVAVVSLAVGACSMAAIDREQEERELAVALESARVHLDLERQRAELADEEWERTRQLYERNLISQRDLSAAELERQHSRDVVRRRELDVEEMELSRRKPRNDWEAPLVSGRDFVRERAELEVGELQSKVEVHRQQHRDSEQLHARSFISKQELDRSRFDLDTAKRQLQEFHQRLQLRDRFLAGEFSALELNLRIELQQAQQRQREAVALEERRAAELQQSQSLHKRQFVSAAEVAEAEVALREAQAERRLADLEVQLIEDQRRR